MKEISPTPLPAAETPNRYPSLPALRAAHGELVQRRRATSDTPELLADVRAFIGRGEATGALLDAEEDRLAAQSLLDFWANVLLRGGEQPPDATLADFDPTLAPELPDAPCPYRGLAAFGEEDREFFFGREGLLDKMIGRLRDGERLLAVVGSSGSGKSSLVLAGLLPRLKGGALPGSEGWRYATIVPGSQPLTSLAHATVEAPAGEAAAGLDVVAAARLLFAAEGFRRDPGYLASLLAERSAAPLVLVVDQLEELFTLCADGEARAAFVRQLLGLVAATGSQHRVILTMRIDFVDNVAGLPDLFPIFRDARVDVEALDINELRAAIEGPAARVGLKFEAGISDDLISTILGERAGLPLLQFTLLKLWEERQRNRVTREVYRKVGNPREALERSAEAFYQDLIPEEKETARRILLRMARPGEGREVTSNRIRRAELFRNGEAPDRVERVLDRLVGEARLVKLTAGETPADAQVEVAHEALVRNWPRLVGWLDDERETLRKRRRLTDAAEQWERTGRDAGALLRGALLEEALRYGDLNELEMEFVQASQAELAAVERGREAARQRELEQARALAEEQRRRADEQTRAARQLRQLLIALAAAFVVALGAAGFALIKQQQASNAQATAQAEAVARTASDYQAAARAIEATAANATAQAEAMARVVAQAVAKGSLATQEADLDNALTAQARRTATRTPTPAASLTLAPTLTPSVSPVLTRSGLRTPTPTRTASVTPSATLPPRQSPTLDPTIATQEAQLRQVRMTQTALAVQVGATATPIPATFPPPGRIVFVSNRAGEDDLYAMKADGSDVSRLTFNGGREPSYAPGTKMLVFSMWRNNRVSLYTIPVGGGTEVNIDGGRTDNWEPTFSPDGGRVAFISSRDNRWQLYSMNADGANVRRLTNQPERDLVPAWSPDGQRIAFSSDRSGQEGKSEIWVMGADGSNPVRLTFNDAVDGYPAWSPDGKKIAFSSNRDGNVEIYIMDADGRNQNNVTWSPYDENYPAWSPDGKWLSFSRYVKDNEIFIMTIDGKRPMNLTSHPAADVAPVWIP
jgi:Tol biopolymer transport system component